MYLLHLLDNNRVYCEVKNIYLYGVIMPCKYKTPNKYNMNKYNYFLLACFAIALLNKNTLAIVVSFTPLFIDIVVLLYRYAREDE